MTLRSTTINLVYSVLGIIVIFGGSSEAADGIMQVGKPVLDESFIFRAVLAGLLGILIWVAKGQDSRLKDAEKLLGKFSEINVARQGKIETIEKRQDLQEHEQKQLLSLISMQREMLLTKYIDKEETERHHAKVEEKLDKHQDILTHISARLDTMARPQHRVSDDKQ